MSRIKRYLTLGPAIPTDAAKSSSRGREAFGRGDPARINPRLPRPAPNAGLAMTASAGIAALCLLPWPLYALPSDSQALMHITSDTSQYNYKVGETWFEGQVLVDQGTTHLRADRLITKKDAHNRLVEAIAYGSTQLAHYWTVPKAGEKELHAYAKIIKFYPLEARTQLEGDVNVTQGENHFQGQIMVYHIKQQTITVPPTKNSRATFVIEADQLKQVL